VSTPAGEPTLPDVQREYPAWRCWRGISGLFHARHASAGPGTRPQVTGEDPLDLRDQIRRAEALRDHDITRNDGNGSLRHPIPQDPAGIREALRASQPASPGQGG
jgi:hypothetical protein